MTYGTTPRRTRLAGYERESHGRYIPASDNDNRARYRYAIFARRTIIPYLFAHRQHHVLRLCIHKTKRDSFGRDENFICEKLDETEKLRWSLVETTKS